MSGKPKPAGSKPKAPASPSPLTGGKQAKSSEKNPSKPKKIASPQGKADSPSNEDPFEVDTSAVRKAIKLSPRPTKSRTYEIVCPMCETRGFMPPSEAGKDVQCANPECIVPVFKSKRPKVEAPPEEEPKSKKGLIIGAVLAAVVIIGVGVFLMNGEDPKVVNDDGIDIPIPPISQDCDDCPPKECDDCKPEKITLAEIKQASLVKVIEAARDRGDHNKNVGTELAAETMALAGDIEKAESEIKRLQAAGRATGYLQLQPYAEIAWAHLRMGNTEAATTAATEGLARANNLPPTVRKSLDSVALLAAALVAVNKADDAKKLVAQQYKEAEGALGDRGRASVFWRAAIDSATYDIGLEASRSYHVYIPETLVMSVVETLVAHGYPTQALEFVNTAKNVASQDACRAAWAGRLVEVLGATATSQIEQGLSAGNVSPSGQVRAWAAVASHLQSKGESAAAKTALDKAIAASQNIAAPDPEAKLTTKFIYESQGKPFLGLNDPAPEASATLAFADLSLVHAQLQQFETAKTYLEQSMAYARAMTPSPIVTQELFDECETREGTVKSRLQGELDIASSAAATRSAFIRYRRQCERLNELALERLQKQVELLRGMAQAGLRQQVWDYVTARAAETDPEKLEKFIETSLPGLAIVLADLNLENDLKQQVINSTEQRIDIDIVDRGIGQAIAAFMQGNWKQSGDVLRNFYKSRAMKGVRDRADIQALGLIADVMQKQTVVETFEFLLTLADPVLRQDAFMLFAAYSVKAGTADQVWEHLKTPIIRELDPLDRAAVYRGLVTGILAVKQSNSSENQPAATGAE